MFIHEVARDEISDALPVTILNWVIFEIRFVDRFQRRCENAHGILN
jgi:hypothetical protein